MSALAAGVLFVLIVSAVFDFVRNASHKDQEIQITALKGQLAEFLLATREPDGASLLENPAEFTAGLRPARIVSIRRPMFTYLLNRGNLKSFRLEDLRAEPTRACMVQFPQERAPKQPFIQTCFAAIPADPTGHYVYFSIRYPARAINRHERGAPPSRGDSVQLRFVGQKDVKLYLTFEQPPILKNLQTSQRRRYDGVHEIAAFLSDDGGRSTRAVNAQAFERSQDEFGDGAQNYVTILGRIDANILVGHDDSLSEWPSRAIKDIKIGIDISARDETGSAPTHFGFAPGVSGYAPFSLERVYFASVPSKADLEVVTNYGSPNPSVIWRSSDLPGLRGTRESGSFARFGDWLANHLVTTPKFNAIQMQTVAGYPLLRVQLAQEGIRLPDIAARAFAWLIVALVVLIGLAAILWKTFVRLDRLTREAWSFGSVYRTDLFSEYVKSRDQIGTLGRVMYVMLKRNRLRQARYDRRVRQDQLLREEGIRHGQEQLRARRSILDAIGHEIRSPLQSLLNSVDEQSDQYVKLERMRRAIETLFNAAKIEDGIKVGTIVPTRGNLTEYLCKLAQSFQDDGKSVIFKDGGSGQSPEGVMATFDPVYLEQIIDHIVDNALRFLRQGTSVEISLSGVGERTDIHIFNKGSQIAPENLETIFNFGVSDRVGCENLGLGLFMARQLSLAMQATIRAENRENGVAFVITLPSAAAIALLSVEG